MNPAYFYSGQHGTFFYDDRTNPCGLVKDWSFSAQMATLDATTLGDTYKVPVKGIRTITGSCTLLWSTDDGGTDDDQVTSKIINKMIKTASNSDREDHPGQANEAGKFKLKLAVDDKSDSTKTDNDKGRGIQVEVLATNISMRMAHGEIFAANVSFESIGAPIECDL